jgi:hypothetical protein
MAGSDRFVEKKNNKQIKTDLGHPRPPIVYARQKGIT